MANLTKKDYLRELVDIKEKLEDFMNLINKGRLTYYKEIALKLRILYCSKSGKPPLFTTICDIFDFDIKFNFNERSCGKIQGLPFHYNQF